MLADALFERWLPRHELEADTVVDHGKTAGGEIEDNAILPTRPRPRERVRWKRPRRFDTGKRPRGFLLQWKFLKGEDKLRHASREFAKAGWLGLKPYRR